MLRLGSAVAATLLALTAHAMPTLAQTPCNRAPGFAQPVKGGSILVTRIFVAALKFRSSLEINIDGAPNAYHVKGRPFGALDTLCNAGKAISSVRGTYQGMEDCGAFLEDVKSAEATGWHGDPKIEWYGIATKDAAHNEPLVQSDGPYKGYFVSITAYENSAFDASDPRHYLDSRMVPFVVLPRDSHFFSKGDAFSDGGAALGNVAFVYDPASQRHAFAIVGDLGPTKALGEGSIALAAALRGQTIDPATLTGRQAAALALSGPIVTVVFSGTKVEAPYDRAQIDSAGATVAERMGGLDALKLCAAM